MVGLAALLVGASVILLTLAVQAYRNPPPPRKEAPSTAPSIRNRSLTQRQQNWAWGLGAAALAAIAGKAVFGTWGMGLMFSFLGVGAPGWIVHRRLERRRTRMIEQMEQVLGRLANAMSGSGATPEMAWVEAAAEVEDPLGSVLREVAQELQVGRTLDEALTAQARYLGIPELEEVAEATAVLMLTGGNLAEQYRRIADAIASRRTERATLNALTAEVKMNGHVVTAVPFLVFATLRVLAPDYVTPVLGSPGGLMLLGSGSALVLGGWFWMMRIADVDRLE